jgi:hypothetical protein
MTPRHTFPDDSSDDPIDTCRGRSGHLANAPHPSGDGCPGDPAGIVIGFSIPRDFPSPHAKMRAAWAWCTRDGTAFRGYAHDPARCYMARQTGDSNRAGGDTRLS